MSAFQRPSALRKTAEIVLHPKKRGSPYPPMTHLAYPMMRSTTAMPHKLSSVSMATPWAFSFTVIGFQNNGIDPQIQ